KNRSSRGTFTSKIKAVIHSVFGGNELPSITTQGSPEHIQEWKRNAAVGRCYSKLFKKIRLEQPATHMSKIIERFRREKNVPSKMQIAYAISISEIYLCPNNQSIQINEGNVKQKIIKNLVSFNFNFT